MSSSAPKVPVTVLLVDNHDDTRLLYSEYLTRAGCLVEEAADGREALAKAIARRHDVVVSAARLPGIDGYQLCQLLRRDTATMATRVIMVTADGVSTDLERARRAGVDATLVTPCLPPVLFAEVQRLVELDRSPSPDASVDSTEGAAAMVAGVGGDGAGSRAHERRTILSRVYRRGPTTTPPVAPPNLRCPQCDKGLVYHHSNIGGVSERHPEQWDYFECAAQCGTFEYRQRTRKVRRVDNA